MNKLALHDFTLTFGLNKRLITGLATIKNKMIIWILMVLDIISVVSLSLVHFQMISGTAILLYGGIYLIIKFLVFKDILSALDLVSGLYMIIVFFFGINSFFYYLVLAWFGYKTISMLIPMGK